MADTLKGIPDAETFGLGGPTPAGARLIRQARGFDRVRVLWQGKPLAGAIVKSWRQPLTAEGRSRGPAERDSVARVETQRTDPLGRAAFDVRQTGEWLLSVVHMVPSADTSAADWQSTWASMTFARRDSSATTPH